MARRQPKPEYIVPPYTILIDGREKAPYTFAGLRADSRQLRRPLSVNARVCYLPTGDYTIDGLDTQVACERKSLHDLYNTLSAHRERFEAELERLAAFQFAAIVIEAEWSEILRGLDRPRLSPKSVYRSIIAWQVRHPRVQWWAVPGRRMGEVTTFRLLDRFYSESVKAQATSTITLSVPPYSQPQAQEACHER